MLRRTFRTSLLLVLMAAVVQPVAAQSVVAPGYSDLSLLAGTGGIGDAVFSVGAKYERALKAMGSGVLGIQAGIGFHSWQFGNGYEWYIFPMCVNATYHFKASAKVDPFFAAGVGYRIANCKGSVMIWGDCSTEDSEVYPIGRVGMRYFTSERSALYVDAGVGDAVVNLGLSIRLR